MDPSAVLINVSRLIQMLILVGEEGARIQQQQWQILVPSLRLMQPLVQEMVQDCKRVSDLSPVLVLELALVKAKELLDESGARGSKVFKVVCCEEIANWFQEVATMLSEALGSIPVEALGISELAQSQADMGMEQLRSARFLPDISDQLLLTEVELLLDEMREQQQVRPEKLAKLFEKLGIVSDEALTRELDVLEAVKQRARDSKHKSEEEFFERIISLLMQMVKCSSPEGIQVKSEVAMMRNLPVVPADFRCPLSLELMADPVIIATGQTYERAYIQQWIDQGNTTCPKTRQILAHTNLIPNYTVKALITNWCETNRAAVPVVPPKLTSSVFLRRISSRAGDHHQDQLHRNAAGDHHLDHHRNPNHHQIDRDEDGCCNFGASPRSDRICGCSPSPSPSPRSVRRNRAHSFAGNRGEDWSFVSSKNGNGGGFSGPITVERLSRLRASPSSGSSDGQHENDPDDQTPRTNISIDASINLSDYSLYSSDVSGDFGSPAPSYRNNNNSGSHARHLHHHSHQQHHRHSFPTIRSRQDHQQQQQQQKQASRKANSARSITDGALRVLIENSVEDLMSDNLEHQLAAAEEIRLLAKYDAENRILIAAAGAVKPLISLVSSTEKKIQENAVTALLNLSIDDANKSEIVTAGAVDPLVQVLKNGTPVARENAAAALFSLSTLEENKAVVGASGAIPPLVDLLVNGSLRGQKDAATALFNLSLLTDNKSKIVSAGAVRALINLVKEPTSGMVDKAVAVLANLMTVPEGRVAIGEEAGGIAALVEVVEAGTPRGKENAAAGLLHLCTNSTRHRSMVLQEGAIPPLHALSQTGTPRAKEKASALLRHFREQRHASFGSRSSQQF